jgi:hypothetical protein
MPGTNPSNRAIDLYREDFRGKKRGLNYRENAAGQTELTITD